VLRSENVSRIFNQIEVRYRAIHALSASSPPHVRSFVQIYGREGNRLVSLSESSGLSSDIDTVLEGVRLVLWQWLTVADQSIIVDSFFVSTEERSSFIRSSP
jgi:hypothetical protein